MNRKQILKDLHERKIYRLPSGFYTGLSKVKLGELIKYVLIDLNNYTEEQIYAITRKDLIGLGFERAMNKKLYSGYTDTFSLLKLAFPDLKPWKMKLRPSGTFDNVENIFEAIMEHYQIGHPGSIKELRPIISDEYVYRHFDNIDDLNEEYDRWIVNKRVEYAQLKQKQDILNMYIYDRSVKLPNKFWSSLTSIELKKIFEYIIFNVFNEKIDDGLIQRLNYDRIIKARLSRLYKEIETIDGECVKGIKDLVRFTYGNLIF